MIKPNELRVGNLIIYAGRIITVTAIKKNLIFNGKNFDLNMEPCYEPFRGIQLTDEILRDWCCFKDYVGIFSHEKIGSIMFKPVYGHSHFLVKSNGGYPLTSVKYLHQLQNLYFALTGEELTVNLPKPAVQHIK
jgi:uncharacterized protein YpbB